MKKVLLTGALIALFLFSASFSVLAQKYEPIYFVSESVATSAVASVATTVPLYGKVVAVFVEAQTNMTFTLTTTANYGLTLGNARTVVETGQLTTSSISPTGALNQVYMWGDVLSVNAGLSPTNIARTLKGFILLEQE